MIEPMMFIGIGFLVAGLLVIGVIPLVHARAVRLTMRRLEALNRIRAAIPCQLELPRPPDGQELKLDEVNLAYASAECESTPFYSVRSADECGSEDGWYYDDPVNPQRIELCPASCQRVSAPGGNLTYSVGCATQFRIR